MEVMKDIKDIKWNTDGISEPIVMASAAGWYVGAIDKSEGFIQPYDSYTDYMTQEDAIAELENSEMFVGLAGTPSFKFSQRRRISGSVKESRSSF